MSRHELQTVKNYADNNNVTTSYIYKLIGAERLTPVIIDGVKFIDKMKFPSIANL